MTRTTLTLTMFDHASGHGGGHSGGGIGGELAHTFARSATSALAWRDVSELFRSGHGIGLVLVLLIAAAVGVYFWRRRQS